MPLVDVISEVQSGRHTKFKVEKGTKQTPVYDQRDRIHV